VSQAAIDNPAGVWLFWDADSDYSRHTDKSRGGWRSAPDCHWEGGVTKVQMAAYANGHAKLTIGIPRPQWYENMALDGKVHVLFQGCP